MAPIFMSPTQTQDEFERSERTAARIGHFAYDSRYTDTSVESGYHVFEHYELNQ